MNIEKAFPQKTTMVKPPAGKPSFSEWNANRGPVLDRVTDVVETISGLGGGVSTAVVTAAAGGAYGAVHGARLTDSFQPWLQAGNLAAIGAATADYAAGPVLASSNALGIAVAAAVSAVRMGSQTWGNLSQATREKVKLQAENLTDKVLPWQQELNPAERFARGVGGELAGAVAGGLVGLQSGFSDWAARGGEMVDWVQEKIYESMHSAPEFQRSR